MDVPTLGIAILAVIAVPLLTTLYVVVVEWLIRGLSEKRRARVRPWLWLLPAGVLLTAYLIYPMAQTAFLSLFDRRSKNFVGLENYLTLFGDDVVLADGPQHRAVDRVLHRGHRHHRPDHRDPRRPGPLRDQREGADLHPDGDQLRRRGRDLEVHVRLRPRPRHAQRRAGRGRGRGAVVADRVAAQHVHDHHRGDLDVGRASLSSSSPPASRASRPSCWRPRGSTARTSSRSSATSSCRCSRRRSPSSPRRS